MCRLRRQGAKRPIRAIRVIRGVLGKGDEVVRTGIVPGRDHVGVGLAAIKRPPSPLLFIVNCLANSSETNSIVNFAENCCEGVFRSQSAQFREEQENA